SLHLGPLGVRPGGCRARARDSPRGTDADDAPDGNALGERHHRRARPARLEGAKPRPGVGSGPGPPRLLSYSENASALRTEVRYSCGGAPAPRSGAHREDALMATTTGTIKRLTDKGFGFIAAPDGVEYFFHQSACQGTRFDDLREGQKVSFDVGQGPKGPRAENVKPA